MGKLKSKTPPKKTPLNKNKTKIKTKPTSKKATASSPKKLNRKNKNKTKTKAPVQKVTPSKKSEMRATTPNYIAEEKVLELTPPKSNKKEIRPLNEEELAACRNKLLEMRQVILYKEYVIKEFTIDKNELSDVLDEATVNDLMSKEVRLRNREIFHLKKINKSLEMIQRGTYGVCQDCDENIPFERMIVRPETDMCISCKENSENEEMKSINDKLPKSQGLSMEQVLGR